jgi:hypothetical protein
MVTPYKQRRINKLTAEISTIESSQYQYVEYFESDPDALIYALTSKKELLIRAIVIEHHLLIEDALDDLIRIEIAKKNKRTHKRVSPVMARRYFDRTFREASGFLQGGSSIGFARKVALVRMLKLIDKRLFDDLTVINTLRNKCGNIVYLNEIDTLRRRPGTGPRYTLSYRGRNLFQVTVMREFIDKYTDVFLRLCEKAGTMKLR